MSFLYRPACVSYPYSMPLDYCQEHFEPKEKT